MGNIRMLRQEVIREIVKRADQERGLAEELVIEEDKGLYEAACEYFGAWTTALHYAGIIRSFVVLLAFLEHSSQWSFPELQFPFGTLKQEAIAGLLQRQNPRAGGRRVVRALSST
jgi:hypothetical protein